MNCSYKFVLKNIYKPLHTAIDSYILCNIYKFPVTVYITAYMLLIWFIIA